MPPRNNDLRERGGGGRGRGKAARGLVEHLDQMPSFARSRPAETMRPQHGRKHGGVRTFHRLRKQNAWFPTRSSFVS